MGSERKVEVSGNTNLYRKGLLDSCTCNRRDFRGESRNFTAHWLPGRVSGSKSVTRSATRVTPCSVSRRGGGTVGT